MKEAPPSLIPSEAVQLGDAFSIMMLLLLLWMVWKAHTSEDSRIDLADMFVDSSGKLGGSQMRLNGAFLIASWAVIYFTMKGTLTEWMFAGYLAAFVVDRVASRRKTVRPNTTETKDGLDESAVAAKE